MWFGTSQGAIGKINLHPKKFYQIPPSLPLTGFPVNAILSTRTMDQIYFSFRNSLIQFNTKTNQFKSFQSPYPDLVSMVDVPDTHLILCGSSNGLSLFDQKREMFSKLLISSGADSDILKKQIMTINSNDSTGFWIGALGNAYKINCDVKTGVWKLIRVYNTDSRENLSISHFPSCFLKDRKDNFWVGTWGGGLNCLREGTKKFSQMLHNPADSGTISDNFVECMAEDNDGNIWVGTHLGVNWLNSDKVSFHHISKYEGLANDWITAIKVDSKNHIWVSTLGGISCISDNGKTIKNFDSDDGLPANIFLPRSVLRDSSGNLYFGSEKGLIWFHPDSINKNPFLPEIVITDFRINNDTVIVSETSPLHQNIEVTHNIFLNYKQSTFSFRIAPLSYFNPKKNRIKYILKGFDKIWKVAGSERIVKYSKVPPGNYIFSVIASNDDGIWNMKESNIRITITRSPWLTGWSITLYILGLIVLIILFINRIRSFKKTYIQFDSEKRINNELIQPNEVIVESAEMQFIQKVLNVVEENIANPEFGVDELCFKMAISHSQLYRKIHSMTGLSVTEFIKDIRLKRASQLLKQNPQSISEIAYRVGFNDPKYFSRCFKQQFGVSPASYVLKNDQSLPHQ